MGHPRATLQHSAPPRLARRSREKPLRRRRNRHCQVFKIDAIPEEERLDVNTLAAQISQSGRRVQVLEDADRIVDAIVPDLRSGDVVAILSNGGFGGILRKTSPPPREPSHAKRAKRSRTEAPAGQKSHEPESRALADSASALHSSVLICGL